MALKPQDILIALKLVSMGAAPWTYGTLAASVHMSTSEVHACIKRLMQSQLVRTEQGMIMPSCSQLLEFLTFGLRYAFPAEYGEMTRGFPTAWAAMPLNQYFLKTEEPPPVWPDPSGNMRGMALSPLYKSAPAAALEDTQLYELLSLVDALRAGRAREREMARRLLNEKLTPVTA